MLSTNQKAKMINDKLAKVDPLIKTDNNLADIELISIHREIISDSIYLIKTFYDIDAKKSLVILPGLNIINPVSLDQQIENKFNDLGLIE